MLYQLFVETIHAESYNLALNSFIPNLKEREIVFNAFKTMPTIRKKADFLLKWVENVDDDNLGRRLLGQIITEGIFFSSAFAIIFWFKSRGFLPAFATLNTFVIRDESTHMEFFCLLYREYLKYKLPLNEVYSMIQEAVDVEDAFIEDMISEKLQGMNADLMKTYVRYVSDFVLTRMGCDSLFGVENPFHFMKRASLESHSIVNFFETRNTSYQKSSIKAGNAINFDADY